MFAHKIGACTNSAEIPRLIVRNQINLIVFKNYWLAHAKCLQLLKCEDLCLNYCEVDYVYCEATISAFYKQIDRLIEKIISRVIDTAIKNKRSCPASSIWDVFSMPNSYLWTSISQCAMSKGSAYFHTVWRCWQIYWHWLLSVHTCSAGTVTLTVINVMVVHLQKKKCLMDTLLLFFLFLTDRSMEQKQTMSTKKSHWSG